MTLLDKADIQEQTAHEGRTEPGTVLPGRLQPVKPPLPYTYVPTRFEPRRPMITYTFWGLPNDTFPTGDCVYFMYSAGRIKIGFSNGVDQRRLTLSSAGPFPPVIVLIMRGTVKDEKAFHERFSKSRLHGEWFSLPGDIQTFLSHKLCDLGRSTLDRAQAEFRDYCASFVANHKTPKRKPRSLCQHGKPSGHRCFVCEKEAALSRLALLQDHLTNPTPENSAAVEAEFFAPPHS